MTADYRTAFKTADIHLDSQGILTIRFHSKGESLRWNALPHRELPHIFAAVTADPDVKVVILTGTGQFFMRVVSEFEAGIAEGSASAAVMDAGSFEGVRLLENLLAIDVPVIAAVNGPAEVHAEIAVLSDIVICSEDTFFSDGAHMPNGLVPADGVQVIWPMLLGPNRGRYFLLTGQQLLAREALALGVVGEVLPKERVLDRAREHAERLAVLNPVVLRNTRRALVRHLRDRMNGELQSGLALEAVASLAGADWTGAFVPPDAFASRA